MSMNVDTAAWGQPFTEYSGLNIRTGAADLEDPDFEDFPPFVRNSFDTETEIQYIPKGDLYYPYLADNDTINLNKPIERSISYCACKNLNIPINQIYGYSCTPDSAANQYPSLTDTSAIMLQSDSTPIPIMLLDTTGIGQARTHGMGASQHYFRNPFYRTSQGVFYQQHLLTQYAANADISGNQGTPYDNTGRGRSNKNLFAAYYRDFGIRSFFLQIRVKYYNSIGSTTETPSGINDKSLYWYSQQTDSWKEDHPLTGAYGRLIVRSSTAGAYTNGNNINPDITINLRSNWNFGEVSIGDLIQQPIANVDTEYLQSAFPIFGTTAPNNWQTNETGTHSNGGISQNVAILIGGGENSPIVHCQGKAGTQYYGTMWCELEGTDDNLELIRKWCAAYGLFFTDGESGDSGYSDLYAAGNDETRWTNEKMCLGVVDEEGYTDGTYTRGTANPTANNWSWKTASETTYNPNKPPPSPENTYSTATTFNSIGDLATMTKRYVLTASSVQQLGTALWDISAALSDNGTDFSELTEKSLDMFLTNNPIDAIISLQRYPLEIPAVGSTTVKLGKTDTGISAKPMEKTAYFYLFYGSKINPKFGDSFLDYQPYTKMELYIPFCGTIQMNPADIIGRTLNVQLVVDFTTGTATGFIMSDDLVIETVNGNIAIDIPVTGIQSATVASQLNNAIANKSNKTLEVQSASLGNVSAGGVIRALKDPLNMVYGYKEARNEEQRAEYDLTHQNAPIHIIGSASAVGGWAIDLQCRLIIYYPSGDVIRTGQPPAWDNLQLARYGHTTGFACCIEGSIGSMNSGLVVGINPDLNGMVTNTNTCKYPATAAELDMLRAAIAEGIIL